MKISGSFKAALLNQLQPGAVFSARMYHGELVRFVRVIDRMDSQEKLGVAAIGPYWADEHIAHYYEDSTLIDIDCFFDESESSEFAYELPADGESSERQSPRRPGTVFVSPDGSVWLSIKRTRHHMALVNLATGDLRYDVDLRATVRLDRYSIIRTTAEGRETVLFDSATKRTALEVAA